MAGNHINIGNVYSAKGDLENALLQYQRALEIHTRVFGSEHPHVAKAKRNIGVVYEKAGKKSEAKTLFAEAAEIHRNMLGPDHPDSKNSEGHVQRLAAES